MHVDEDEGCDHHDTGNGNGNGGMKPDLPSPERPNRPPNRRGDASSCGIVQARSAGAKGPRRWGSKSRRRWARDGAESGGGGKDAGSHYVVMVGLCRIVWWVAVEMGLS